jgi:hypothetical protein
VSGRAAAQNFIFVDDDGLCDGEAPCFTTIQQAVNSAVADNIIFVFDGIYQESVDLGGMSVPGDITIIGPDVPPLFAPQPAETAESVPPLFESFLPQAMDAASDALAALRDAVPAMPNAPFAMAGTASVDSNAGPAIHNTVVSPFPGAVAIIGLRVHSDNDDGIRINADGRVSITLVHSNMNGGNGFNLTSDGCVSVALCRANENSAGGIVADSGVDITIIDSVADGNKAGSGMSLIAISDVEIVSFLGFLPIVLPPGLVVPERVSASSNAGYGIFAGAGEEVAVGIAALAGAPPLEEFLGSVVASGNDMDGMNLTSVEVSVLFATASMNKMSGIVVTASEDAVVVAVRANGNTGDGVRADPTGTLIAFGITAIGNGGTGLLVSTTAMREFLVSDDLGAFIGAVRAEGNQVGIAVSVSMANLIIENNAVIGNTDGVVLNDLGLESRVAGNIICDNTSAGLRSNVNANILGVASWWGDPSGPSHTTKNPAGTGDAVVDATSGGGMGDVTLVPFIDTITGSIEPEVIGVGQEAKVRFSFTGAGGTVYMGFFTALGFFGGFPDPPLTLDTGGAGLLTAEPFDETPGSTVDGFVNAVVDGSFDLTMIPSDIEEVPVVFEATLVPTRAGERTVELSGPCGISGSVTYLARDSGAPVGGFPMLALLVAALGWFGVVVVRRRLG